MVPWIDEAEREQEAAGDKGSQQAGGQALEEIGDQNRLDLGRSRITSRIGQG